MTLLVSACLLGLCTRYDGGTKPSESVLRLAQKHTLVPVCPEQLGGLSTPRAPAEQQKDGRVQNREGQDVTEAYTRGAQNALTIYRLSRCEGAILKARSPSCGRDCVYDGTFTGTLVRGSGVFAALCQENGIKVYTEEDDLSAL